MSNLVEYFGDITLWICKIGDWVFTYEIPIGNITATPIWLISGVGIIAILGFKVVRLVVG